MIEDAFNKYTLFRPPSTTLGRRSGYEQPTTIPQVQDFGARITVEASRSTIACKDSGEESKPGIGIYCFTTTPFTKGNVGKKPPYCSTVSQSVLFPPEKSGFLDMRRR